jgi:hypothetical protein
MFVARELIVDDEYGAAGARLAQIAAAGGLTRPSQAAYRDGLTHLARVGPLGDIPGVSKLVAVRVLDPAYREDTMTVALRWEATGAAGSLFPVLDANISLSPAGDQATRLALSGAYRAPLGRVGAALDKAILNRVAAATVHALLHGIAGSLTSPATAEHPTENTSPRWRPVPEPEMP